MKRITTYFLVFIIGLSVGFVFLWKERNVTTKQQIDIITNGIKNVSKLVVTEASFSEIYNYEDVQNYLFETIEFKKKIILLVNAKVLVSYDLKKLEIEIDTIQHKLLINYIPEEELNIIPDYKYYDFQQSIWNTFTKEELNKIQKNSMEQLVGTVEIVTVKQNARKQLVKELNNLLYLSETLNWTLVDKTDSQIINELELKL